MPSTLNPETLLALRKEKELSQAALAELCRCTPDTVGRWERGEVKARRRNLEALSKALDVNWEVLCRPHQPQTEVTASRALDDGREEILRNLNARISPRAHLALDLASQRYGVLKAGIVELAPLLFMIAAEQSLADRAERIGSIRDALCEVEETIQEKLSRFSVAMIADPDVDEDIDSEEASIARREVFGHDHWRSRNWDSSVTDPFGSYLRRLVEATGLSPGLICSIDHGRSVAPPYRLGIDALKSITGLTEDTECERNALDHIGAGLLDVRELLAKRKSLSAEDFQEWFTGWVDYADTRLD